MVFIESVFAFVERTRNLTTAIDLETDPEHKVENVRGWWKDFGNLLIENINRHFCTREAQFTLSIAEYGNDEEINTLLW